jgi:hypothetical protein
MEEYIEWLENKIEVCLEDKDLQREHWAFCQALKKYRDLALRQSCVRGRVCFSSDCFYNDKTLNTCVGDYDKCTVKQTYR